MRVHAKKLALPLTVTRPARCLEHGCVLVDKQTGKITIPIPTNGFSTDKHPYIGLPESMTETQFLQVKAKDKFYRIISTAHAISMQQFGFRLAYPCFLQYDGASPTPLPRMPDFARTLLQQYVLNGPLPSDLVVPVSEKLNVNISEELRGYINQYPLREQGLFCEVCRKPAKKNCNTCRTAWYCCRDHQTSDWKDHRAWCKSHRVAGSSTSQRRDSGESQASTQLSDRVSGSFSMPQRRDSGESQASTQLSGKIVARQETSGNIMARQETPGNIVVRQETSPNIVARQETSDMPKAVAAAAETEGETEIVSHEQNGQKGEEVSISHVIPQEVKTEVIERLITPEKTEENVEQDNAKQDNAKQDNTEQDHAEQDSTVAVKEEPIASTSTELESSPRPQKVLTLRDRDPRPLLRQVRAKLSLVQGSDARAVFHRNLKILVRLLYSWKFYFCIGKFQSSVKN
jgi:hypothetical protein